MGDRRSKLVVAGIVAVICAGLYPTVVVPLQIAYAGREHPAQRRMREEAEQRARQEEEQKRSAEAAAATPPVAAAAGGADKPKAGFARSSMWASIDRAAKSAKS